MANSFALRNSVRYNAEDFPRYFRQLRGLCLKSKGAWILNKLVTNPIDKFINSAEELRRKGQLDTSDAVDEKSRTSTGEAAETASLTTDEKQISATRTSTGTSAIRNSQLQAAR